MRQNSPPRFRTGIFQNSIATTLLISVTLITASCKKTQDIANEAVKIEASSMYEPQTASEIATVKLIKKAEEIIKKVYKNHNALQEVLSTIQSKRRPDESIFLSDLLKYKESDVYKTYNVKSAGSFASEFEKYVPKYSNTVVMDTVNQADYYTYANSNITIYFPYSENYVFDSLNQANISLVGAQSNTNAGPGEEPLRINDTTVLYYTKTVNDEYAEVHPTHIVGVANEKKLLLLCPDPNDPACGGGTAPGTPPQPLKKRVYIGRAVLRKQFDHLISFTGNGGGSEIKFCHLSGYLSPVNGQITTFQDVNHVTFSRKDIRRERTITINNIWDDDWEVNDVEQVLAIYEEDNTGTVTFGGSLTTTLTVAPPTGGGPGGSVVGAINFSVQRQSQDDIIKQLKFSRNSYFTFAKLDQGWGFDNDFRFGFYWPKIDWQPTFGYTMPYQQL